MIFEYKKFKNKQIKELTHDEKVLLHEVIIEKQLQKDEVGRYKTNVIESKMLNIILDKINNK